MIHCVDEWCIEEIQMNLHVKPKTGIEIVIDVAVGLTIFAFFSSSIPIDSK